MKILMVMALVLGSAVGVAAQDPPSPTQQVKVVVVMNFNGTKANPKSQIIVRDNDGTAWWWGTAKDEATYSLLPGPYIVTVDTASASFHTVYFTSAGIDGIPNIATYYLYQLGSCADLTEAKNKVNDGNLYGCVAPNFTPKVTQEVPPTTKAPAKPSSYATDGTTKRS